MSDEAKPKTCSATDCDDDLSRGRFDCLCGCGKSWCRYHGMRRKRIELPGDKSYLVRVDP